MKATEFIVEHKKGRKAVKHNTKPRNPVAHAAQTVAKGSGAHKDKKKAEKQGNVKHKKDLAMAEGDVPFAGAKVGHKEGKAGQWRNDGPKKNKPAKAGDLVGGS